MKTAHLAAADSSTHPLFPVFPRNKGRIKQQRTELGYSRLCVCTVKAGLKCRNHLKISFLLTEALRKITSSKAVNLMEYGEKDSSPFQNTLSLSWFRLNEFG